MFFFLIFNFYLSCHFIHVKTGIISNCVCPSILKLKQGLFFRGFWQLIERYWVSLSLDDSWHFGEEVEGFSMARSEEWIVFIVVG